MSNHTGKLQGKIAIVTGGGSGFGAGIVRKFITEGVKVLILDINQADAERVGAEAPKGAASAIKGNVSSEHDWQMALTLVLKEFGGLDVVVNNAGVLHTAGPSIDLDEKEYDRVMRINVKQLFWSTKVIIPYFTSSNRPGLFINTSSISGARPRPNLVWYAASKGAVNSATKGLAVEWAKHNIRFNAICPAVGNTAMLPIFLGHDQSTEAQGSMYATIPLRRVCQPEDVANAASFLASDEATYITGICLDVDGGRGI
ncbi:hypothetical protein ACEPPN_005508 [Leptodophora sp. 'Broadleaf-Isolate-01']